MNRSTSTIIESHGVTKGAVALLLFVATFAKAAENNDAQAEFAIRPFVRYAKSTFLFFPKNKSSLTLNSKKTTQVLLPNVSPEIGLGFEAYGFAIAYAQSAERWQRDKDRRGLSKTRHFELHWTRDEIGIDLYYNRSLGLYSDQVGRQEIGLFGDSLFRSVEQPVIAPDMALTLSGARVLHSFDPIAFSLRPAIRQSSEHRSLAFGWSWLGMAETFSTRVSGPNPFLNPNLSGDFSEMADVTGITIHAFGLAPGIGIKLDHRSWFATGAGFWGYTVSSLYVRGAAGTRPKGYSPTGNLRGDFGWQNKSSVIGITGFKTVIAPETNKGGVAFTTSLVELYSRFAM